MEEASELGEPLAPTLASPAGGDHALNKLLTPLARHSLDKLLTPLARHSLVPRHRGPDLLRPPPRPGRAS